MHQSVNGNIKHKICDKWEGDFAGNKASTAVSAAIFLVCFGCTVYVGLDSSCDEFLKKMFNCSYWFMTRRQFSVRICSSQLSVCLTDSSKVELGWGWEGGRGGGELLAK